MNIKNIIWVILTKIKILFRIIKQHEANMTREYVVINNLIKNYRET